MRIDVRSAARSHALSQCRPHGRPFVQFRTFSLPGSGAEKFHNLRENVESHFPLISGYLYNKRSSPNPEARNIAIIGGGITGLSTAYYISKDIPHAKITIFERSDRLGGWLDSERLQVDGGEILFEWGPRSLRPDLSGPGMFTGNLVSNVLLYPRNRSYV